MKLLEALLNGLLNSDEEKSIHNSEAEMNAYGLDEEEKKLVRNGTYDLPSFDTDDAYEEDDYYSEDE